MSRIQTTSDLRQKLVSTMESVASARSGFINEEIAKADCLARLAREINASLAIDEKLRAGCGVTYMEFDASEAAGFPMW